MDYHYVESGLDNVWLVDGYTVDDHPDYGELVHIEHVQSLHRFIGRSLIALARRLNGAEFRFLRKELDVGQKLLADLIGSNEQSVAKWEKARNKPVGNKVADRMVRLLYSQSIDGNPDVKELLLRLSDLDAERCDLKLHLSRLNDEWAHAA